MISFLPVTLVCLYPFRTEYISGFLLITLRILSVCLKPGNDLGAILLYTLSTFSTDMGPSDFKKESWCLYVYVFVYLLSIFLLYCIICVYMLKFFYIFCWGFVGPKRKQGNGRRRRWFLIPWVPIAVALQVFAGQWLPFFGFQMLRGKYLLGFVGRVLLPSQHKHGKVAEDMHAYTQGHLNSQHDCIERWETVQVLDRATTVFDEICYDYKIRCNGRAGGV
jgi:hypothetical protein